MPTKKIGDLIVSQIARWTRLRAFKGLGETGMQKCWWGKFSLEDLGTWPFMVKGLQHRIFVDNGCFASERAPVFKFRVCPGFSVGQAGLWFWVQLEVKVLSSAPASAA